MKILALATNSREGASTRYRILQWVPALRQAGIHLDLHAFFPPDSSEILYRPGKRLWKLRVFLRGMIERYAHLRQAAKRYDALLIHREMFPLGLRIFFKRLRNFSGPIIYDYDDAMFLRQRQDRWVLRRLERPETVREVISISRWVLAGNDYLAAYAQQYNPNVTVLPTSIDTNLFRPLDRTREGAKTEKCVIGWIGSHSTTKYLLTLEPVFKRIAGSCPFTLKVVGAREPVRIPGVEIINRPWSLEREIEEFQTCDIGVYPLPNDGWGKGKCGFKAIQFMAVGVPVVAAAVGVNKEIVQEGTNGFLASSIDEWCDKISILLTNKCLRGDFGLAARQAAQEKYSLDANAPKLLKVLNDVLPPSVMPPE